MLRLRLTVLLLCLLAAAGCTKLEKVDLWTGTEGLSVECEWCVGFQIRSLENFRIENGLDDEELAQPINQKYLINRIKLPAVAD